jgi:hypothetical protein
VSLHRANHNVFASVTTSLAFIEHLERFTDSGGVTEKDFQAVRADFKPLF